MFDLHWYYAEKLHEDRVKLVIKRNIKSIIRKLLDALLYSVLGVWILWWKKKFKNQRSLLLWHLHSNGRRQYRQIIHVLIDNKENKIMDRNGKQMTGMCMDRRIEWDIIF